MSVSYGVDVKKLYEDNKKGFILFLSKKYKTSGMRDEDIEDIYQDTFMAVFENMAKGKVKETTCWESYIMAIGMNMASKRYRKIKSLQSVFVRDEEGEGDYFMPKDVMEKMTMLPEEEPERFRDPENLEILDRELAAMPENQKMVIILHYIKGKKDEEIAEMLPDYSSAKSVKVVRNRYVKNLKERVNRAVAC